MHEITFPSGSVPIALVARIFGKDPCWVRTGIIRGWLPIGVATRGGVHVPDTDMADSSKGRINYYISPQKLYEFTGFIWKGEKR